MRRRAQEGTNARERSDGHDFPLAASGTPLGYRRRTALWYANDATGLGGFPGGGPLRRTPFRQTQTAVQHMIIVAISVRLFQGSNTDSPVLSRIVSSRQRRGARLLLMGLVIFLLACARGDAGEQESPAPPAKSKAPATLEKPKYLLFWSDPEKAGELAERIGMKGDGKTRLLGFGLPTPTFELEERLPSVIRSAFTAARKNDMAVMLHFDLHLAWKKRPDLWNWFDPNKPGYNPDNKNNVEWHGWDGPPNKIHYLNHGVLERLPPNMCLTGQVPPPPDQFCATTSRSVGCNLD
jgi:hypothetical protein